MKILIPKVTVYKKPKKQGDSFVCCALAAWAKKLDREIMNLLKKTGVNHVNKN